MARREEENKAEKTGMGKVLKEREKRRKEKGDKWMEYLLGEREKRKEGRKTSQRERIKDRVEKKDKQRKEEEKEGCIEGERGGK